MRPYSFNTGHCRKFDDRQNGDTHFRPKHATCPDDPGRMNIRIIQFRLNSRNRCEQDQQPQKNYYRTDNHTFIMKLTVVKIQYIILNDEPVQENYFRLTLLLLFTT